MAEINSSKLHARLFTKLASVIEEQELDGKLILAGGEQMLCEQLSAVMNRGKETSTAIHVCRNLVSKLRKMNDTYLEKSYWNRLKIGSEEDREMVDFFAGSMIEPTLRAALQPQCRD